MVEFLAPEGADPRKTMVNFEQFQKFYKFTERPADGTTRSFLCHDGSVFQSSANYVKHLTLGEVHLE